MLFALLVPSVIGAITSTGAGLVTAASAAGVASSAAALSSGVAALGVVGSMGGAAMTAGVASLASGSAARMAVTAIRAASTAEKLWTASALLGGGYAVGKYILQKRNEQQKEEAENQSVAEQEAEIQAAIRDLRKTFPEATDEELRKLLFMYMQLEDVA